MLFQVNGGTRQLIEKVKKKGKTELVSEKLDKN